MSSIFKLNLIAPSFSGVINVQNKISLAETPFLPILFCAVHVWAFPAKTQSTLHIFIKKLFRQIRNASVESYQKQEFRVSKLKKILHVTVKISMNVLEILSSLLLFFQIMNLFNIAVGNGLRMLLFYNKFFPHNLILVPHVLLFLGVAVFAIFSFTIQQLK